MNTYIKGNKEFDLLTKKKIYEGGFKNGKRHGKGAAIYQDHIYKGDFEDGYKHGKGIECCRETKKVTYKGEFIQDLYHGKGIQIDKEIIYKGTFESGLRHGRGKILDSKTEELIFRGEFVKGKRHGKGELFIQNRCFEGSFDNGKLLEGNEYHRDDNNDYILIYTGQFSNLKWHGTGITFDKKSGQVTFVGIFENNKKITGRLINHYKNHCHKCKSTVNTNIHNPCFKCYWLKCGYCDSCGCNFMNGMFVNN
jgi:hypothetical protein